MNDEELISKFIKVKQEDNEIRLLVRQIFWPHPHEPRSRWTVASVLPQASPPQDVDAQIQAILENSQYFKVCQECAKRKPRGWMHNSNICQSCAERNYGVVY